MEEKIANIFRMYSVLRGHLVPVVVDSTKDGWLVSIDNHKFGSEHQPTLAEALDVLAEKIGRSLDQEIGCLLTKTQAMRDARGVL